MKEIAKHRPKVPVEETNSKQTDKKDPKSAIDKENLVSKKGQ